MEWLKHLRVSLAIEFADRPMIGLLATVSPDHTAAGRCVVLRDVTEDGQLVFTTDSRSEKMSHLSTNSSAECVFWLPTLRLQFRIAGKVSIDPARRVAIWAKLSPATQDTFFGPPPGTRKDEITDFTDDTDPETAKSQSVQSAKSLLPSSFPAQFAVLGLTPDRVESLDLTTDPHTRVVFSQKSGWQPVAINP